LDAIAGWVAGCRQPAGAPACNLMFNSQLRGGLGRVLKYLGGVGRVTKYVLSQWVGAGSGVGEHPLAGVHHNSLNT